MRETYVRPVTEAREPQPEWRAVWRFRVVAFVLLAVMAVVTVWGVNQLMHLSDQDPTSDPNASAPLHPSPDR